MGKKKGKSKQTQASAVLARDLSAAKPTAAELATNALTAPRIGLGLESKLSKINNRVRREDTHLDQHTTQESSKARHHALYTAGWSLSEVSTDQ